MITEAVMQQLKTILKDAAYWQEHRVKAHWESCLSPLDLELSGVMRADTLNELLNHLVGEGLVTTVVVASGEPHGNDDMFYVEYSAAGVSWLSLDRDKSAQA